MAARGRAQISDWRRPSAPFQLIDNVYWVGTYDLSTYLITTDAGRIIVNTGFADTVPEIAASQPTTRSSHQRLT